MKIQENEKTIDIYPFVDDGNNPGVSDGAITVSKDHDDQLININCPLNTTSTKFEWVNALLDRDEWEQFKTAVDKAFEIRETLQNGGKIDAA